jgi:hypothetical protein
MRQLKDRSCYGKRDEIIHFDILEPRRMQGQSKSFTKSFFVQFKIVRFESTVVFDKFDMFKT